MSTILDRAPQPLLEDVVSGRCIPIIGAGFSRNAVLPKGKSIPLWDELGKMVARLVPYYQYTTPIDAMSAYSQEFSRTKLVEKLAELLHIDSARPGLAHEAFGAIPFSLVCTTNFDFLLEKTYERLPQSKYCRPVIDEDQLSIAAPQPGVLLLKFHGDLHHPNRLVITEEDYDGFVGRYPLLATYLANLLITRTPLFIGYSLDDPDFRQIWQIIRIRLGQMRRPAYIVSVGIHQADAARYERRGVKVINLPGRRENYGRILASFFEELRAYWLTHVIPASTITVEKSLTELTLPRESPTRLCFFAVPLCLQSFYKSSVFPVVEAYGLVPIMAEDVISPGEAIFAKIEALIDRAQFVVAEVSSPWLVSEIGMAISRKPTPPKVLAIVEEGSGLPVGLGELSYIIRPTDLTPTPYAFLSKLEDWFQRETGYLQSQFYEEPYRLLKKKEYRAAVISALTLLETTLQDFLSSLSANKEIYPRLSFLQMLEFARKVELFSNDDMNRIRDWVTVRNRLVHTQTPIRASLAREIVQGIMPMIERFRREKRTSPST